MEKCVICSEGSIAFNAQGMPVCKTHKDFVCINLECPTCGGFLDAMRGKYGTFFNCMKCGNFSLLKLKAVKNLFFEKQ
ncbi:hypothetical protein D6774_03040 [Candidatus Woesearchaeota archaeon]|jgi:hypothetical protein|nr:MAG: hypothetical protein D6774_03040 [Candidatus Woesearchaeota archaeon]